MAIGLVIDVAVGQAEYDAVMRELGLDTEDAQWPEGIISHTAGPTDGGWRVVDVWASKAKFDQFMEGSSRTRCRRPASLSRRSASSRFTSCTTSAPRSPSRR